MRYYIERLRRTRYAVVDRTGQRHSIHPNFEAAVRQREALNEAERLVHGPSQSALYRQIANDPELKQAATTLRALKKARNPKADTLASYRHAMAWMECDPDQAEQHMRRSVRRAAARVAVAARQKKRGRPTRDRVAALTDRGIRQVDIADHLGISTRQVRKHQKRNQRPQSFPTGLALEYSAEHSPKEVPRA